MKPVTFAFVAALAILAGGCQIPGQRSFDPHIPPVLLPEKAMTTVALNQKIDPAWLLPQDNVFTLGPGDHMEIEILGDLSSRSTVTVGPDGKIYFNLLQGLDVWGLTLEQTRQAIERELTRFLREPPQVAITLRGVESKRLWLLGRFQTPGVYAMSNSVTLLEAIYQAGGPMNMTATRDFATYGNADDMADLGRAFVLRHGHPLPVDIRRLLRGDLSQNIYLQSEDYVYLPPLTAHEIHVLGAVTTPRAVAFTRELTLVQALAACGGTALGAHLREVAVVRGSLRKPSIALVDYHAIITGRAPDVYLAPDDIVYVPYVPWRILERYLDVVATTFVGAVAINEGAAAVLNTPPSATGILIPFGSRITVSGSPY